MQRYRGLVALAAIVFIVAYLVAPAFALVGLLNSLKTADSEALPRYVDFSSLRASLKEQVSGLMLADPAMAKNPFALALGPAIINTMIDNMVTPSGLAGLITQGKASSPQSNIDASRLDLRNVNLEKVLRAIDIRGLFEFRLAPTDDADQVAPQFVFRNSGVFDWKLVDIRIPPNALNPPGSAPAQSPVVVPQVPESVMPAPVSPSDPSAMRQWTSAISAAIHSRMNPRAASGTAGGTAVVRFTVTREGEVKDVALAKSSGNDQIDRAALAAFRESFPPAPAGVTQQSLSVTIPLNYRVR